MMPDRVDDRGRRPSIGISPTLGAEGAVLVRVLEDHGLDLRRVERRRHDVVGQLRVGHPPVAHDDFFQQRVADALRGAPSIWPGGQDGMDRLARCSWTAVTRTGRTANVTGSRSTSATSRPSRRRRRRRRGTSRRSSSIPAGFSYCFVMRSGPCFCRGIRAGDIVPSAASSRGRSSARIFPTTMQVREATVGPLSGTCAVSASETSTRVVGMPSVSATIWACIVRVPWPISVEATRMRAPSLRQLERRLRGELDLAAAGEARAVEEEREADARGSTRRAALRRLRKSVRLHRLAQHPQARCSRVPSFWPVAVVSPGRKRVDLAQPDGIDAERLGDPLHVDLGGELRLRRAEAAEGAVGRRVRHRHAAADAHVVAAVRSRWRGGRRARGRRGERDVGAAVEEHVDVHRGQPAVASSRRSGGG